MEVECKLEIETRLVILVVSGELDDAGLLRLGEEVEKTPEAASDFSLLIDLRKASGRSVTTAGTQTAAMRPLVLAPAARRAVVVPSELGFGMARMYEMLRGGTGGSARVFRDYDEALRWVKTGS